MTELSTAQAAEILGFNRSHVNWLVRSGELPGEKCGQAWRVTRAVVEEYKRKQDERHRAGQKERPTRNRPARRVDQPLPPDDTPYNYEACHNLACAILFQATEDVKRNDPGAVAWIESRWLDHWCELVGLRPDAVRERLYQTIGNRPPKYTAEMLDRIIELHDECGMTWSDAMRRVTGYCSTTLRDTIARRKKERQAESDQ